MPPPGAPVRVARVITRLNVGGPAIQAMNLTARLGDQGFETVLIHGSLAAGEGDMRYLLTDTGNVVHVAALRRPVAPLDDLHACWTIFRLLRRFRPAIVHTHMAKAGTVGRLAALAYNLLRPRGAERAQVVHTYHGHVLEGYFSRRASGLIIGVERLLARWTDRLIAISPRIQHELAGVHRIGRPEQYRIVPLGFDLSAFAAIDADARARARAELKIPAGAQVVAWVGRLTAIKDPSLFVDAARLVHQRHPGTTFLLAGDGELRGEVEARAAATPALPLTLLGWRRDLARIYAAADVFVLTSRNEGTPVALIEAMASGVPGVSTDVGGVADVITDPMVGGLVGPRDPAAVADAINRVLDAPALRAEMGDRARAAVMGRYSLDRLILDIRTLYDDLLGHRG